jgi:hypothetical protein
MDFAKLLVDIAITPARVSLAAADAGIEVAGAAINMAKRSLGDATVPSPGESVAHLLGIDETIERANRFASLLDDDTPLGRALAPDGAVDRLLRPGGLVDKLLAPDGLLDRMTAEGSAVDRALAPDGLVDRLLGQDGVLERVLAEDGVADRLLSEGGLVDKLTAKNGPLEQLAAVTDSLNRLTPGMEELAPTIETLREAVVAMTLVVNPLSTIAERIPMPGRGRWPLSIFGTDEDERDHNNRED